MAPIYYLVLIQPGCGHSGDHVGYAHRDAALGAKLDLSGRHCSRFCSHGAPSALDQFRTRMVFRSRGQPCAATLMPLLNAQERLYRTNLPSAALGRRPEPSSSTAMQDRRAERKASEIIPDFGENEREAAGCSTVPPARLRTSENTSSSSFRPPRTSYWSTPMTRCRRISITDLIELTTSHSRRQFEMRSEEHTSELQ